MKNSAIPQIRMPGYNPIELLDGNTRLKMVEQEQKPRGAAIPVTQSAEDDSTKRTARMEIAAAMALIFGFTLLFWVLLGYLRSR